MTKNHHNIITDEPDLIVGKIPTEAARRQSLATTLALLVVFAVVLTVPYKETIEVPVTVALENGVAVGRISVGKDVAKIAVGQDVVVTLDACQSQQYRTLHGRVASVAYNSQNGNVEASVSLASKQSEHGKSVTPLPRMAGTARVVTGQKPLARWLLPQLPKP